MEYLQRILVGLILMILGFAALYLGSPMQTGYGEPNMAYAYAYVLLFALGFMLLAMGLLALQGYPGMLSSFVLYFIVGALVALIRYVMYEGEFSLVDAGDPVFWMQMLKRMALWPLEIVRMSGIFEYRIQL